MSGEWFHCGLCEIDFTDPHAPEVDGMVYGQCPECVRTIERLTNEEFERLHSPEPSRPEKNLTEFAGGDA